MKRALSRDRQSRRGRRPLRQTRRPGARRRPRRPESSSTSSAPPAAGHATELAREATSRLHAISSPWAATAPPSKSSTAFSPTPKRNGRPALGFLPLGTGNSFLRDFTKRGAEHTIEALSEGRRRPCDVIAPAHTRKARSTSSIFSASGFTADVAALTNRRFKRSGELGYILGVFVRLAQLERRAFPLALRRRHRLGPTAAAFSSPSTTANSPAAK